MISDSLSIDATKKRSRSSGYRIEEGSLPETVRLQG